MSNDTGRVSDERLAELAHDPMMCNLSDETITCLRELEQARKKLTDLHHSHAELVKALRDAQEELQLIREKDCNSVYDIMLRAVTIPLALERARRVTG